MLLSGRVLRIARTAGGETEIYTTVLGTARKEAADALGVRRAAARARPDTGGSE